MRKDALNNPWVTAPERRTLQAYLKDLQAQGRTPRTCQEYLSDWRNFGHWFADANGERFAITNITAIDVKDFKQYCQRAEHTPATINRRLVFLKQYCRFAAEKKLIAPDILLGIQRVPLIKREALAPRSLAKPQIRKYLREVDKRASLRDKALINLLLYTGIRASELAQLKKTDIKLSDRKGAVMIRSLGAKRSKERVIPIAGEARQALSDYWANRKSKSEYAFVGQRGPLTGDGVAWVVKKYGQFVYLNITPHVLRHTFAYSYLENNQNDLVGLAKILGHDSVETTQIYTQKRMEDLEMGVENVKFY